MLYVVIIDDFCALYMAVFSILSVGIISLLRLSKVYRIDKVMSYMI